MVEHKLAPKHELLSPEESQKVLEKYNVTRDQMPKIRVDDDAVKHLKVNVGDIIKIIRESEVIGKSIYFRVVVE